jgi:hypothetical protein
MYILLWVAVRASRTRGQETPAPADHDSAQVATAQAEPKSPESVARKRLQGQNENVKASDQPGIFHQRLSSLDQQISEVFNLSDDFNLSQQIRPTITNIQSHILKSSNDFDISQQFLSSFDEQISEAFHFSPRFAFSLRLSLPFPLSSSRLVPFFFFLRRPFPLLPGC